MVRASGRMRSGQLGCPHAGLAGVVVGYLLVEGLPALYTGGSTQAPPGLAMSDSATTLITPVYDAVPRWLKCNGGWMMRCFFLCLLSWKTFDKTISLVTRCRINHFASPAVSRILFSVMFPVVGFMFAMFTERAVHQLVDRIDLIENLLNREAGILAVLLPKLDALLIDCPSERAQAFSCLNTHVDRLVNLLQNGHVWHRGIRPTMMDPMDPVLCAVVSAESRLSHLLWVSSVKLEQLRCVNDLLNEFAEIRNLRKYTERMSLPLFHWVASGCYSAIFTFGFLLAVVADDHPSGNRTSDADLNRSLSWMRGMSGESFVRSVSSCRLRALWVLLILSQYLVVEMSLDMQNPYTGQYKIDDYGILQDVFAGPIRSKLRSAAQ